ncbi:MAG: TPM domain-containing protein [Xanthomonadales bacterium]|nr:TPM domain-containing protein [Xanthomonadales bacterium]
MSAQRLRLWLPGLVFALAGCREDPQLVVDHAKLFDADEAQRLAMFHRLLLADHDIDYRVVTVERAEDINVYAARAFAEERVGAASGNGYGLLLVVENGGQRVRLEVGYGLEGYFPDAFVAYVEHRQMLPFFAARRVGDGILATTEMIVDRAQRYALGDAGASEAWRAGSGGAGATARIGQAAPPAAAVPSAQIRAGGSPEDTLRQYFTAMAARNADPSLPIYSPESRAMLSGGVMTPAQMDNLVAAYRQCQPQPTRYDAGGQLAVIRYPIPQRRCAPWFFRHDGEAWRLDLTMMRDAVRFGRDNSWHFAAGVRHPYEFAFTDWNFDRNGFPVR